MEHVDLKAAKERWLIPNKPTPKNKITGSSTPSKSDQEEYLKAVTDYRARCTAFERWWLTKTGQGIVNNTDRNTIVREAM